MAADDRNLLFWTDRLFGLPADDVAAAVARVRSLNIRTLTAELVEETSVDAAVGCYFLDHALDTLLRFVPESKLMKKLRDDREIWPAWCELRTAALLVEAAPEGTRVEMDPGRAAGAQPDLRIVVPDDPGAQSVEIKSIGLADEEVAFCERMAPALTRFAPTEGFVTVTSLVDDPAPRASRDQRRAQTRGGGKRIRAVLPDWPTGVSGASVVLHGAEHGYMRRVALRIRDATRQLPTDDECLVALYWTNGAPTRRIAEYLRWDEIPENVQGIVFAGTVAVFPDRRLHAYQLVLPRGAGPDDDEAFESRDPSDAGRALGRIIHEIAQGSSGVRATLLRASAPGVGRRTLVLRDGSRRLSPFNLMLERDQAEIRDYMDARRASEGP